jgi:DNA-binding transcriptional ArsR family regulator
MNIMPARSCRQPLDATLLALNDPTRRSILRRLARSEARVTELAAPFSISLNSVSKHIRILERARLVQRRKVGREYILRFRPEPLNAVQKWLIQQQAFWRASLEAIDELIAKQTNEKQDSR